MQFLYRLGREFKRVDFWNLSTELTRYEQSVHRTMFELYPPAAERDDIRAAWNTTQQIITQMSKEDVDEDLTKNLLDLLLNYMKLFVEPPKNETVKLALARISK